jgi:hypothetical protein
MLAACANSPSDDLARVQSDLIRLEKLGVADYLPMPVAVVQENLRIARDYIQHNRFELASGPLAIARVTLDSCASTFVVLRTEARSHAETQLASLQSGLDSLAIQLKRMPRRSYLDQNRYDLHSIRLKEMNHRLASMHQSVEQKDYPSALTEGQVIERHLHKSLAAMQDHSFQPVAAISGGEVRQ